MLNFDHRHRYEIINLCFIVDKRYNSCDIPEEEAEGCESDFIESKYSVGSLVWARVSGYPSWPAMVDDDPDIESYFWLGSSSNVPTHYHVVFLDEQVSRAFVPVADIKPFTGKESMRSVKFVSISQTCLIRNDQCQWS